MEKNLVDMFKGLNESYKSLESRLKAEGFKVRIMKIFRTWEEWAVYSRDFLIKLQNTFLGISTKETTEEGAENVDGVPLSDKEDEDLDGVPLDGAKLLKGALMRGIPTPERDEHSDYDDDIDGVPRKFHFIYLMNVLIFSLIYSVEENIDGVPLESDGGISGGFVKSKWEELDPEQVAHQAITTSKWELLQDPVAPEPPKISSICNYGDSSDSADDDSKDDAEEKRRKLRQIEVKVLEYQEELESGERQLKSGWSIRQQVEHYRRKLLKKSEKNDSDSQSDRYMSSSSKREIISSEKKSKKSRKSRSSSERERYQRSKRSKSSSPSRSRSR